MKDYIDFLLVMTEKEIKARYKNAVLGFLWVLLNPLFQMIIIGFLFQNFISPPTENYYLFLFSGLLPWNFFSYSLTKTTPSIIYERSLIQKAKFPRESIPLSIVFSNFFHFIISLFLLIILLIISGNFNFNLLAIVCQVASLIWFLSLTCGLTLLTSALNVKYRDIKFFTEAIVLLWFYATPVVYSLNMLPKSIIPLFGLNPITYPLTMLQHGLIDTPLPNKSIFWSNFFLSLIIISLGITIFKKENKTFSDWL